MIAGVDEVGRGCVAGPVFAACVVLGEQQITGIRDSKKLSAVKRQHLAKQIKQKCLYSIASVDVATIDKRNILQASLLSFEKAVALLPQKPDLILVDGNFLPQWQYNSRAIVKGDAIYQEIAAASIIAKVARDSHMEQLQVVYPNYSFGQHKGYLTKQHLLEIQTHGVTPIHRTTFEPIKKLLKL